MASFNSATFVDLGVNSAEQFLESVSEPSPNTKIYLTYGKIDAWANDLSPDVANTSVATAYEHWFNMIGGKRLVGSDFHHVIPRIDWVSGRDYVSYDHMNPNLHQGNTAFYVMTNDFNVYKCLSNNSGQVSTVEPTSVNPFSVSSTSDGYVWKYMYTLSDAEQLRFTTDEYIPVKTLTADDGSQQWEVQQNAVVGGIYNVVIEDPGQNYTNSSNIIITSVGDGTGFAAIATVNTISNTVNAISVTDPGEDYTFAYIVITDTGNQGANATARAIISPPGGHGHDPLYELGGKYVMINGRLRYDEEGVLPTTNEYRQIAIISNPLVSGTSNIATSATFLQAMAITTVGAGDYTEGEYVYQGVNILNSSFSGRVLSWNSATSELLLINIKGAPTGALTLVGAESFTARSVSSITEGDIEYNSGRMLYLNNIMPITRDPEQIEDFKIVIKF